MVRDRIKTKHPDSVLLIAVVFSCLTKWCFLLCSIFFASKMLSKILKRIIMDISKTIYLPLESEIAVTCKFTVSSSFFL